MKYPPSSVRLNFGRLAVVSSLFLLVLCAVPASSGADITSNLAGYWTFDTAKVTGSTVLDSSGRANNGTLGGTTLPTIVTGKIGQSVNLTTASQLVNVLDSASLNLMGPFTVAAWVQFNSLPGAGKYPSVVAKLSSPSAYYGYGMYWNGAGVAGIVGPGSARWYTTSPYTPTAGTWHHYASVFDGTYLKLYIDGTLYSQVASTAPGSTAGTPVKMGPHYSNPASYGVVNGKFDEVRIYGRALAAADISSLYTGAASGCTYALSSFSASFASAAGNGSVGVTASAGCSWTAVSGASWITITGGASGSGNGTVSYSVAANTTTSSRSGTMTIAGMTFTVTQGAGSTACTYAISPASASFASAAGNGSVSVTAGVGCSRTAVSGAAWITITSGSTGTGNGAVYYSVAANTSTSSRSGTLTIAGKIFTVTQAAGSTGCTYTISPASASFASAAGNGSVSVTAGAGCSWTATSGATWITITAGASGSGNATVSYSVAANTSTR
jgi:hypothetical protein